MRSRAARALLGVATGCIALTSACGSANASGERGEDVRALEKPAAPSTLAGLEVVNEDVEDQVSSVDDQYFEAVALYSVRDADKAVATLQIAEFGDEARFEDKKFRDAFVTNLGGQRGVPIRVGDQQVEVTQGNLQRIAVWFRDDLVFVLTTREDFTRPRTLLRAAVEIGQSK